MQCRSDLVNADWLAGHTHIERTLNGSWRHSSAANSGDHRIQSRQPEPDCNGDVAAANFGECFADQRDDV